MKAAVDTNVLLDLLGGDAAASSAASHALSAAIAAGPIVICPIVYAELAASFGNAGELEKFLRDLAIELENFSPDALRRAAGAWQSYVRRRGPRIQCSRCGHAFALQCPACQQPVSWRQHIISDFLIGGHAEEQADILLTRDAGYYRTYFPRLQLVDPTTAPPPP